MHISHQLKVYIMKTKIKLVIALIAAAAFMGNVAMATVVAAWNLNDAIQAATTSVWTSVSTSTLGSVPDRNLFFGGDSRWG